MKHQGPWKSAALASVMALGLAAALAPAAKAQGEAPAQGQADLWAAYLDYAYVYSSAEPDALKARLAGYGREAGMPLEDYIQQRFEVALERDDGPVDEAMVRRKAVAHLLHYLSEGEPRSLDAAAETIRQLKGRLERHENRYWHHYILAHRALEKGQRFDFVGEMLELWLNVIIPLESPYETLQTLSLSDSPNSGFVSALPYLFENTSRMILIRTQQMGMNRSLDPLAAIVRSLAEDRVGAFPDVIPPEATSRRYLERVVERLDGAESDGGSLTFTLALFEASKVHDEARSLLASEGFSPETMKALRVASGAYETAWDRADTLQGQAAVYRRVLRQLGEVYAAKQRLGMDPDIETPFSIEGAIEVYGRLEKQGREDGWMDLGFRQTGRQSYVQAMHGVWEEIQEASLNAADYYLTRSVEEPHRADEHARNAAQLYARYLGFFHKYASQAKSENVPDSAYFAAYEAARGYGDSFLVYSTRPKPSEVGTAVRRYLDAVKIFPFDAELWPALTTALERQGRESEYLDLVRPVAESVARSRYLDTWIGSGEPGSDSIGKLRRALSDDLVIMYLGFANEQGMAQLQEDFVSLQQRRDGVKSELTQLVAASRGMAIAAQDLPAVAKLDPYAGETSAAGEGSAFDLPTDPKRLRRRIEEQSALLTRLEKQIEARERALPLFEQTLAVPDLADELRGQRDHPVHTLLRRMYDEHRS